MRVLHTDFLHGWGGQPYRILLDATQCAALGAEVMIAAPTDSELGKRATERGLNTDMTISYRSGLRVRHLQDILRLRKIINKFCPEILHLHGGKDSWLASQALIGMPERTRPVVLRTKHNLFPVRQHAMNRWIYGEFFDHLIAISTPVKEDLASLPFIDVSKIRVIPDAYDDTRFTSLPLPDDERSALRASFGFDDTNIVCITVARFETEKGLDVLIEAAHIATAQNPNLRFLLVGDGRLRSDLHKSAEELKLPPNIFCFVGFREDIPRLFKSADIAIVPSRSEGMGTVALEAGICGIPVVASRCGGLISVVKQGITGLLFESENPTDLSHAVLQLAQNDEQRQTFSRYSIEFVQKHFSPHALGQRTINYYTQILK